MASTLVLLVGLLILCIFFAAVIGLALAAVTKRKKQPSDAGSPHSNEPTWESVGAAFRLAPSEAPTPNTDAFTGIIGGYPVRIVRIKPWRHTHLVIYKTEISTYFARPPQHQFIVHGKAKILRGDYFPTGDGDFDDQFVVRSNAGPAVLPLFNHRVRSAIAKYNGSVPSLGLSNKGVEVLIEGAIPPLATIGDILRAQAQLVASIEDAGSVG